MPGRTLDEIMAGAKKTLTDTAGTAKMVARPGAGPKAAPMTGARPHGVVADPAQPAGVVGNVALRRQLTDEASGTHMVKRPVRRPMRGRR